MTPISDQQLGLLEKYVDLLTDWNTKINLVSRRDTGNIWSNHILHSISFLFKLQVKEDAKVLDLGTGGGLPGIPFKIVKPEITLTMLDSTQKKILAVQDMIQRLELKDTRAVWGRAEELGLKKGFAHSFDYVVARAVAPLPDLVRFSVHFLCGPEKELPGRPAKDSRLRVAPPALIAFKGGEMGEEEKRAILIKEVEDVETIQLAFEGSEEISLTDKKIVVVRF